MSTTTKAGNAPTSEAGEFWALKLGATGKRPKTIATYLEGLRSLEQFTGRDGDAVTRVQVLKWMESMGQTLAPASASVRLRSVKTFFRFCVTEGLRNDNPAEGLTIKVPKKVFEVPTPEEIEAMLAHCRRDRNGKRHAAIIALLATTGARAGEIGHLRRQDVDFANGEITLHNSKSVPRRVALRKGTALHLKRWMFEPRRTDGDNLWDVRQPVDLVKRTVPRHTNGRWTAHSLRRAFAVTWLLADGSAPGLMATCGWTDPTMVSHYTQGAREQIGRQEFRRIFGD